MFKVDGAYLYLHYWNRVQEFDLMAPGLITNDVTQNSSMINRSGAATFELEINN